MLAPTAVHVCFHESGCISTAFIFIVVRLPSYFRLPQNLTPRTKATINRNKRTATYPTPRTSKNLEAGNILSLAGEGVTSA